MTPAAGYAARLPRLLQAPRLSTLATRFRPSRSGLRTTAVVAALAAVNVFAHRGPYPAAIVVPVGAGAVLAAAFASGLRLRQLGLHITDARSGLRWALIAAGGVAAIVVTAMAIPATAELFQNNRYGGLDDAAKAALITIPLITVLPEELLFRGVLDGALQEHLGTRGSYVVGSLAFGAWHVLTSGSLTAGNAGLQQILGDGALGQVLGIAGAVVATSLAGVVFIWLRRKTGSVLAPMGLHWAINGIGAIAAGAAGLLAT